MAKRGKRYLQAQALIDQDTDYGPSEAVALVKQTASAKFDEAVEVHLRTGCDPRHADQLVRGATSLPHGLGKQPRVLVFATGEAAQAAQKAGADFVGDDDLIKKIEDGWVEFDVAIATPDIMGKVGKLGKVLGRRGLMPNPKSGTVVPPKDVSRVIDDSRKGRVEFRLDRTAIIHAPVGKAAFEESELLDNLITLVDAVVRSRPSGVKGQYIKSAFLSSAMGPSIRLDLSKLLTLKVE